MCPEQCSTWWGRGKVVMHLGLGLPMGLEGMSLWVPQGAEKKSLRTADTQLRQLWRPPTPNSTEPQPKEVLKISRF